MNEQSNEIQRLMREIERQDAKHGPFEGTALGRSRLALACLEDEMRRARLFRSTRSSWEDSRSTMMWSSFE